MDTADQEWEEFQRTLGKFKKTTALRDQLNVISAQLNEIEQDTKDIQQIKQELMADQNADEQMGEEMAGMPTPDMMGGAVSPDMMGGAPPAPGGEVPPEQLTKSVGEAELPTEPIADAVNMDTGDEKVQALFTQLIQALSESAHVALDNGDIGKLMKLTNMQSNLSNMMGEIAPLVASVPQNDLDGGVPLAKAEPGEGPTMKQMVEDQYKQKYKINRRTTKNLYKLYNKFKANQDMYLERSTYNPANPGIYDVVHNAVHYADPDTLEYLIDKYHTNGQHPSIAEMIGADILSQELSKVSRKPVTVQPKDVPTPVVHYINRKIIERTYPDLVRDPQESAYRDGTGSAGEAKIYGRNKRLRAKEVATDPVAHFLPYTPTPLSHDELKASLKKLNKLLTDANQMWTVNPEDRIRGADTDAILAARKEKEDVENRVNGQFADWQKFARAYPKAVRYLVNHKMSQRDMGSGPVNGYYLNMPLAGTLDDDDPAGIDILGNGPYPVDIQEGNPDFDIYYELDFGEDEDGNRIVEYAKRDEFPLIPPYMEREYGLELEDGWEEKAKPVFAAPKAGGVMEDFLNRYAPLKNEYDTLAGPRLASKLPSSEPTGRERTLGYEMDDMLEKAIPALAARNFNEDQASIMREYLKPTSNSVEGTTDTPGWENFVEDFPTLDRYVRKYGTADGKSELDMDYVRRYANDRNPVFRRTRRDKISYSPAIDNMGSSYLADLIDPAEVLRRSKKKPMTSADLALAELGNFLSRNSKGIKTLEGDGIEVPKYSAPGHEGVEMAPIRSKEDYAGYYTQDGLVDAKEIPTYSDYVREVLGDALADPSASKYGINPNEVRIRISPRVPKKEELTSDEDKPPIQVGSKTPRPKIMMNLDDLAAAKKYVEENIDKPGAFKKPKKTRSLNNSDDVEDAAKKGKLKTAIKERNKEHKKEE